MFLKKITASALVFSVFISGCSFTPHKDPQKTSVKKFGNFIAKNHEADYVFDEQPLLKIPKNSLIFGFNNNAYIKKRLPEVGHEIVNFFKQNDSEIPSDLRDFELGLSMIEGNIEYFDSLQIILQLKGQPITKEETDFISNAIQGHDQTKKETAAFQDKIRERFCLNILLEMNKKTLENYINGNLKKGIPKDWVFETIDEKSKTGAKKRYLSLSYQCSSSQIVSFVALDKSDVYTPYNFFSASSYDAAYFENLRPLWAETSKKILKRIHESNNKEEARLYSKFFHKFTRFLGTLNSLKHLKNRPSSFFGLRFGASGMESFVFEKVSDPEIREIFAASLLGKAISRPYRLTENAQFTFSLDQKEDQVFYHDRLDMPLWEQGMTEYLNMYLDPGLFSVAMIGVWAAIGVPQFTGYFKKARDAERDMEVNQIATIIKIATLIKVNDETRSSGSNPNYEKITSKKILDSMLSRQGYTTPESKNGYDYAYIANASEFVIAVCSESDPGKVLQSGTRPARKIISCPPGSKKPVIAPSKAPFVYSMTPFTW